MKLLIIDRFPKPYLTELKSLPIEIDYFPELEPDKVIKLIPNYEILLLNSKVKVGRELIDAGKRLQLIVRLGSGLDHFDLEYLEEKGISVANTVGANADAVGEQTLGMLISLMHNLRRADQEVRSFQWKREENRGTEIGGKTVGIIGYGHTGSAFARRLAGFGSRILAYDKYRSGFNGQEVMEAARGAVFRESDILSLHIPLTEETRGMVNDDFFSRFNKPIVFLNLSRGPIVKLDALLRALDDGKVTAAGLDVLPNEKLDTLSSDERKLYEDLFSRGNVILTPHIGGWTHESRDNMCRKALEIISDFADAS